MASNFSQRNLFIANLVAGILIFILILHCSIPYYSYMIAISFFFFMYEGYSSYRNNDVFLYYRKDMKWMTIGIAAFYGSLLVSSVLLKDSLSVDFSLHLLRYALPLFIFMLIAGKYNITRGFFIGLTASALISAVYSLLQLGPLKGELKFPPRIQGFYYNPNYLGLAIATILPFLVFYYLKINSQKGKALLICTIILELFSLYFTKSRGPLIGFTAGITASVVCVVICYREHISKRILAVIFSILVVFGIVALASFSHLNTARTMGDRKFMWQASVQMWNDHKLLGVGAARWGEVYNSPHYYPQGAREVGQRMAHNMPLQFASSSGLVGLAGYVILNGITLIVLLKQLRNADDPLLPAATLASYIAVSVEGMVDGTVTSKTNALILYAVWGYGIGLWRPRK